MPDEKAATSAEGEKQPDKTYTKAEVDASIKAAKDESWKHWQSVTDKTRQSLEQKFQGDLKAAQAEAASLRKAQLEAMSPEQRTAAMLEDMHKRLTNPELPDKEQTSGDGEKPRTSANTETDLDDVAETVTKLREDVAKVLKDTYQIDPTKIDWAEGVQGPDAINRFIKSVVDQVKGNRERTEEQTEAERVDTARGGGSSHDIKNMNPEDLIRQGGMQRIRGNSF